MSLEFSREVDIKHVPQKGQSLREQASQEECASLAARYKIDGVKSFELEVDIVKWKKSALRAKGKVKAVLVQECVVSLALFEQEVEEAFSVLLLPDYMMQTDNASTLMRQLTLTEKMKRFWLMARQILVNWLCRCFPWVLTRIRVNLMCRFLMKNQCLKMTRLKTHFIF